MEITTPIPTYTLPEVAALAGVTVRTVERWITDHGLAYAISARSRVISVEAWESFVRPVHRPPELSAASIRKRWITRRLTKCRNEAKAQAPTTAVPSTP